MTYDGEICQDCNQPLGYVWNAPDWLWERVMGGPGGILCATCFIARCAHLIPEQSDTEETRVQEIVSLMRGLSRAERIKGAWDAVGMMKAERDRLIREAVADGYSQREIARLVGVSPSTICRIAPAKPRPKLSEGGSMTGEREQVGQSEWKAGDPCGVCGSTNTGENEVEGGFCGNCGACDSDE